MMDSQIREFLKQKKIYERFHQTSMIIDSF